MAEEPQEKFGVIGWIMYSLLFFFVLIGVAFLFGYHIMAKGGVTSFNHSGGHIHGLMHHSDLEHYNLNDDGERSELESGGLALQEGDEAMLTVDENGGSTGYQWNSDKSDCSHVLSISSEYDPPANDGMVGKPGKRTFTVEATAPGECTLRLEQQRAWDKDNAADTIEISVTVA